MRLPIYEISGNGQGNKNPDGPSLELVGPGSIEIYSPDILKDTLTFFPSNRLAYLTNEDSTGEFTAEFIQRRGEILSGVVMSTDTYGHDYGWRIGLFSGHWMIWLSTPTGGTYRWRWIPTDLRGLGKHWAVVKKDLKIMFYYGTDLVYTYDLPETYNKGNVVLLGSVNEEKTSANSSTALNKFEKILFNPGHTLEPKLFSTWSTSRNKDVDNSYFKDEPYVAEDLTVKTISEVSSYLNQIIIKFNDGSMESFPRPQGLDAGNYISNIETIDGEILVTLDDGSEIQAGTKPPSLNRVSGDMPEGSGYKVADAFLPFSIQGNLLYLEDGIIKANVFTENSLDYAARIRLVNSSNNTEVGLLDTQNRDDGWIEYPHDVVIGPTPLGETLNENYVLNPGKYYVDGYVWVGSIQRDRVAIFNDDDEELISSALNVGSASTDYNVKNARIKGIIEVPKRTALHVRSKPTANFTVSSSMRSQVMDLSIFKVA